MKSRAALQGGGEGAVHGVKGLPSDSQELAANFEILGDWEERYGYLVELGRKLPPLADDDRTDARKIHGCMSQVWIARRERGDGRLWFDADSDAAIVRGLIAVLVVAFGGRPLGEAAEVDIDALFVGLGLEQHLTVNRRNGFFAMVGRLKQWARSG